MFCLKKTNISRLEIIAIGIIIIGYLLELQIAIYNFKEEQMAQENDKKEIEKKIEYYQNKLKCY